MMRWFVAAPLVAVESLEKLFPLTRGVFLGGGRGEVHAVDGVSFDIPRGGTLGPARMRAVEQHGDREGQQRQEQERGLEAHDRPTGLPVACRG